MVVPADAASDRDSGRRPGETVSSHETMRRSPQRPRDRLAASAGQGRTPLTGARVQLRLDIGFSRVDCVDSCGARLCSTEAEEGSSYFARVELFTVLASFPCNVRPAGKHV